MHRIKNIFKLGGALFLLLNCINTFGQNIECDLVKKAIETEYFMREFNICKIDSSIVIYDKVKTLNGCLSCSVCHKTVSITTDSLYKDLSTEKYSMNKPKQLIILYDYRKIGDNKYTLSFWRPYSDANLSLTYKVRKCRYRLIKHSIGTF